eukprot:TRINITY_DN36236_c0_g1_i1.p1 TRINITY_DN36236_c0_g1~~TRINITY_DN36236_c0_g1_i1.p1  ORF type:complete len:428 (+),score=67.57 TRINITY_DN36236_c0_g1_i1:185-1468(+)
MQQSRGSLLPVVERQQARADGARRPSRSIGRVLLSGLGFLADSYDIWVINICTDIMKLESYEENQTDELVSWVKSSLLVGSIVGQLGFGWAADHWGRKSMFVVTCLLVVLGSLCSALVVDTPQFGIYSQLCVCRFVLGLGIGGEYPLSATITSESSVTSRRGTDLATVFAMQGVGRILCNLVLLALLASLPNQNDLTWRLALGFGAVPGVLALYWRVTMEETVPFATCEKTTMRPSLWELSPKFKKLLLGTAGAWFLLDVTFYGNSLFSGDVTQAIGAASTPRQEAVSNLWINLLSMPGYILSILFLDSIGRKRLQCWGFVLVAVLFAIMSSIHKHLLDNTTLYIALYSLTFLFVDFGPNVTTFIIPVEAFPTPMRATCHGVSAAVGKVGAVVGVGLFKPLQDAAGIPAVFFACAMVSLVGLSLIHI